MREVASVYPNPTVCPNEVRAMRRFWRAILEENLRCCLGIGINNSPRDRMDRDQARSLLLAGPANRDLRLLLECAGIDADAFHSRTQPKLREILRRIDDGSLRLVPPSTKTGRGGRQNRALLATVTLEKELASC